MQARYWALGFGIIYVLIGIVGFIPALYTSPPATPHLDATASYGLLFGLFPVNAVHDAFHIVVGLIGIAAFASAGAARVYSKLLFVVFGILTVMGFMPTLNVFWGLIPLYDGDTWLHAATSIVAGYFGWVADESATMAPQPATSH
jgi:hypothetical protein